MTTLYQVAAAIQGQISAIMTGIVVGATPITVDVAVGWPPEEQLALNVRQPGGVPPAHATVAVYDRKIAKNSTRWMPFTVNQSITTTQLMSALAPPTLDPNASGTLTLGGTLATNDAVSLVAKNGLPPNPASAPFTVAPYPWNPISAVVASAGSSDTLTTLATQMAGLINADPTLSTWISASATGPVVTLHNISGQTLALTSATGNNGTETTEIGRRCREYQIVIWAPSEEIRQAVGDPIESLLQNIETNTWLAFPDGTQGRLLNENDYYLEDATAFDTLRRDFHVSVDYGITTTDVIYSVLAPVIQYQF